jgi:hypothetical protein
LDKKVTAFTRRSAQNRNLPPFSDPIICYARVSVDGRTCWHRAIGRVTAPVGQIVNPTIVMLAPGILLLISAALIAGGFGFHFPKGYIYDALAFSGVVEGLKLLAGRMRNQPPK